MPTVSQQRTLLLLYNNTALTFHLTSANSLPTTHAPLALQQHGRRFSSYKCQQSPNNARSSHSAANTALTFHLTSANSLPTTHAPLTLQQHGPNFAPYKCLQSPNNARSSCSTATRPIHFILQVPTVSQQRTLLLLYSNTALTLHLTSANSLPTTHAPLALQQHGPNFSSYKCQQSPNNARFCRSTATRP